MSSHHFVLHEFRYAKQLPQPPYLLSYSPAAEPLTIVKQLRFVPGKRLVALAKSPEGKWVVAKIFLKKYRGYWHAHRERKNSQILQQWGIATPQIVSDVAKQPVVLFQYLSDAVTLGEWWQAEQTRTDRTQLLQCVMRVLAALHQAGLYQRDIHLDNFLWDGQQIQIIDVGMISTCYQGKQLPIKLMTRNLAHFLAQLEFTYQDLCQQSYDYYQSLNTSATNILPVWQDFVEQLTYWQIYRTQQYQKKIFRSCSAIAVQKSWQQHSLYQRQVNLPELWSASAQTDNFLLSALKLNDHLPAYTTIMKQPACTVQMYPAADFGSSLRQLIHGSDAAQSWRNAHILSLWRIAVFKPLAMLEQRCGPLIKNSYLLSEYVAGVAADDYFATALSQDSNYHAVLQQLTALLVGLYQLNLVTEHLQLKDFWVAEKNIYLIDLSSWRWYKELANRSQCWQALLIELLNSTPAYLKRDLKAWLGCSPLSDLVARPIGERVVKTKHRLNTDAVY